MVQGRDPDNTLVAARRLLARAKDLGYTGRGPKTWAKYTGDLELPAVEPLESARVLHDVVIYTVSILIEDPDADLANDLSQIDVGAQMRVAFDAAVDRQ